MLLEYARTWERRPLLGADRRARRSASPASTRSRRDLQRLADPRGLAPADADAILARAPVVTWLMHAVHGNEISSSDAALMEAYHLLAAQRRRRRRRDPARVDRDHRPARRTRTAAPASSRPEPAGRGGRRPTPSRYAAEHDEPWPGGRSNHYLFDMNRDWFAQSQPETRGRASAVPRVLAAGGRRPARDGRRLELLLRAAGRSAQPAHHQGAAEVVRHLRPGQRRDVRRARVRLFHPRGLRLVLSGLRRVVADLPGRRSA